MKYLKISICTVMVAVFLSAFTFKSIAENKQGQSAMLPSQTYGKDKVAVGMNAPQFITPDNDGKLVSLSSFKGKKNVLLVFYPGDNTPGCTKQLSALRDNYKELSKLDIEIFGINPADAESHNKFIKDYSFPFRLLIDKDKKISEQYDAVNFLGFINRTVVLINKEGKIVLFERGMPNIKAEKISKLL